MVSISPLPYLTAVPGGAGWHSVYCAFRHSRHLGSGVDDGINVALLPYGGLYCVLLLAYAFGKGGCPLCAQFRLEYWCRAAAQLRQYSWSYVLGCLQ